MEKRTSLITILCISIAGLLFSGFLSYNELFLGSCATNFIRCGSFELADLPACVYGFIMYLALVIVSSLGLQKKDQSIKV